MVLNLINNQGNEKLNHSEITMAPQPDCLKLEILTIPRCGATGNFHIANFTVFYNETYIYPQNPGKPLLDTHSKRCILI